jgi:CDP-glucose 4,6-dehydratase
VSGAALGTLDRDPLRRAYSGKRCLLTGHTGFKGAWLALLLNELGADVWAFALDPHTDPSLYALAGLGQVLGGPTKDLRGDLRDPASVSAAVEAARPEIVLHLAAQAILHRGYADARGTFETNVSGTLNLLEALRSTDCLQSVVVVTTDKCYPEAEHGRAHREEDPLGGYDPYSGSKAACEVLCASWRSSFFEQQGVVLSTARAGNVLGGGDWGEHRVLPDAVRAVCAGRALEVRSPEAVRPWQHVLDPLSGYLLLGAKGPGEDHAPGIYEHAFNFGPPDASCRPVGELLDSFNLELGQGSWEHRPPPEDLSGHESAWLSLDWGRVRERLGWRPRWGFEKTLRRTARWYAGWLAGEPARALCAEDIEDYLGGS